MVDSCRTLLNLSALCLISLSSLVVVVTSEPNAQNTSDLVNYIATAELADGEQEVRMRFGDIIVRETSISSNEKHGKSVGLLLRQMSSGPDFLQMVFKVKTGKKHNRRDKLVECEVIHNWGAANKFRSQFQEELNRSGLTLTVPVTSMNPEEQSPDEPVDNETQQSRSGDAIDIEQGVVAYQNMTFRVLRNDEVVGELQRSFDIILHQRLCRRLHRKEEKIAKIGIQTEENESTKPTRNNGFLLNWEIWRVPGTKWCGVGTTADKFSSLGAHVGADRCCRAHDGCPYQIPGFTSKYGLFNYRVHTTISHCACDERFRSCLKMTNTGAANFVGKIFFNIVQTKCFVLEAEKTCAETSWWGKCLKTEHKKQAKLRDPVPY